MEKYTREVGISYGVKTSLGSVEQVELLPRQWTPMPISTTTITTMVFVSDYFAGQKQC